MFSRPPFRTTSPRGLCIPAGKAKRKVIEYDIAAGVNAELPQFVVLNRRAVTAAPYAHAVIVNEKPVTVGVDLCQGILRTRSDQALAIDLGRVCRDLLEFEQECAAGDWEAAIALDRGELLEGFGLAGAPAFEDWLSAERGRVRQLARKLAWREAGRARTLNDHRAEIAALRRLLSSSPYDEPAARSLMQALERVGDRAGALLVFEQFAACLRKDLETSPAPETMVLAATLRASAPVLPTGPRPSMDAAPPFCS